MPNSLEKVLVVAAAALLTAGTWSCKKKEKKASGGDDMSSMAEAMDAMKTMKVEKAMKVEKKVKKVEKKKKPKKLTFEEQVAITIPLAPKPTEGKIGKLTIKPELCQVEGHKFINPSGMSVLKDVLAVGSDLYVLNHKGHVLKFNIAKGKGCKLTKDKAFGNQGGKFKGSYSYAKLSALDKGRILASSFMGSVVLKDGKKVYDCKERGQGSIVVKPGKNWGLGYFANATVNKLTFAEKACKSEPWILKDLSKDGKRQGPFTNVNTIGYFKKMVLVGGVLKKKVKNFSPRVVAAYKKDKPKFMFGAMEGHGDDTFGWVHAIQACKKGKICVLDANFRRLSTWNAKGKHTGSIKLSKVFDVKYPWIASFSVAKNGDAWFVVGQDRTVKAGKAEKGQRVSVAEGLIYRVTGL